MSSFLVHHQLPDLAETHVHWVGDAIQPSHPLSSPSGSFPMGQLFASGGQSIGASASASVLPMNIQGWFLLGLIGLISFSPRDSQESSPIPQFKSINSSWLSFLYGPTLTAAESTRLRWHRNGQKELPHVRGQGGRPRGDTQNPRSGERPRGVIPCLRSGVAAEWSYPASEVRGGNKRSYPASKVRGGGREEIHHATSPRPRAVARRSNPPSKEPWLRGRRRA